MASKKSAQLSFDVARKPSGHGGWRPGAGRKPRGKRVPHRRREELADSVPQHVTLRVVEGVSLRREFLLPLPHRAIARSHKPGFSIIHFNILTNHLHAIVEAASNDALATGLQGFEVRVVRAINRKLRRRGELFDDRYHARSLRTPAEVSNALRYVLNNARHHAAERGRRLADRWFDPYSSAAWFDGWATPLPTSADWHRELQQMPPPTRPPTFWLLRVGWRKHGLLALEEIPGSSRPRKRRSG